MAQGRNDPIALFLKEHSEALEQLKTLNKSIHFFSQNGYSSKHFKHILDVMKYIEYDITVHNVNEEHALFPLLERYVEGPTRILREDHKKLKLSFHQMQRSVEKVNEYHDSFSAIKSMSANAGKLAQLLINHINKENQIIFPLLRQIATKDEMHDFMKNIISKKV